MDLDFDSDFYLDLYPDLRKADIRTHEQAYQHYSEHGKKEGRICHPNQIKNNIQLALSEIEKDNVVFQGKKKYEEQINILIRTSNRPEYFKECINSILQQKYINFKLIICYDKSESLDYLNDYQNDNRIQYFHVNVHSNEKYKFNLYCNILMDKVHNGWIMFLDDDDKLTHNRVLSMINERIESVDSLYIWKFMRPDKLIYPRDMNNIRIGDIDTTCFCFHNKYKYKGRWPDKQYGDFTFFTQLIESYSSKILMNNILTQTINQTIIGNFGD